MLLAMVITSDACVLLFFYPDPLYRLASLAAGGSDMSDTQKRTICSTGRRMSIACLRGSMSSASCWSLADFVVHRHIDIGWEKLPAFYALYGFVACVMLVLLAKKLRKVVMRKEDYYDE